MITYLGSLFQCLTNLGVKNLILISSLNLPWDNFILFPWVPSLITRAKRPVPAPPLPLRRKLCATRRSPLSLIFSRLNKPSHLSCSSYGFPCRPFTKSYNVVQKAQRGLGSAGPSPSHHAVHAGFVFLFLWSTATIPCFSKKLDEYRLTCSLIIKSLCGSIYLNFSLQISTSDRGKLSMFISEN